MVNDPTLPRSSPQTAPDAPPRKMVINEAAILAVATALAKHHHGEATTDPGGYLDIARTVIVALVGLHDSGLEPTVEVADPAEVLSEDAPVQEPAAPETSTLQPQNPPDVAVGGTGTGGQQGPAVLTTMPPQPPLPSVTDGKHTTGQAAQGSSGG
jgi:hypothetical protein